MLTLDQLKQAVHEKGVTKTDAALLCVAAAGGKPATTAAVRSLAKQAGVKSAKTINFSSHLSSAEDKVFKGSSSWELTPRGREYVAGLAATALAASPAAVEAQSLRALLPQIKNDGARAFVAEAIVCAEQSLFRAAVVLSWVGAVALLHEDVISNHLTAFNVAGSKRDPKWKTVKNVNHLQRLNEAAFLEIAESASAIDKNVKQELEVCLDLRNGCGHPNSLKVGPNKVASHLETLALNVFARLA